MGTLTRIRRAAAVAGVTALAAGVGVAVSAAPAQASWYAATTGGSGVTIRDCYHPPQSPSTNCTFVAFVPANTPVRIVCQRSGQNIGGDPVWNYIVWEGGPGRPEGLASDYYIYTGYANWIPGVDHC
ncbi:hypothetical protein [Micromonospora sp. CP22]|uniref:hypothetical protein n=1 Tax=Micromonospora sp. CP22 TaxID=2580517 RepID=UPI0012BC8A18|nr:hypothetical protein [Micromonospora sp. CP22]MTK05172.1 hypothetical protein [Micromonospora sp. CP22]